MMNSMRIVSVLRSAARFVRVCFVLGLALATSMVLSACWVPGVVAAVGDNIDRGKNVEVLAKYQGLENQTVAILFNADMAVLYEHPTTIANMAVNLATKLQREVPGIKVLNQHITLQWMHLHPSWSTMAYSSIADELDVERIVVIDLYEFRLTPPGNRWIWEGVAAGNVGVVEVDGLDPDAFAEEFLVKAEFPTIKGLAKEQASRDNVELGLQTKFYQDVAFLFYDHVVPKHPEN